MLNRLSLKNFKAWREADLTFGKVTGFFGTNSAGKSSLLHLLLLLKQTRNATDRGIVLDFGGPGHLVNLGSFEDAVYKHDKSQAISWLLDWTLPGTLAINDPLEPSTTALFEGNSIQMRCEVGLRNKRLWPRELEYRFADTRFRLKPKAGSKERFELATDSSKFGFLRNQGRPWPLPSPVKSYLFPSAAKSYSPNSDAMLAATVRKGDAESRLSDATKTVPGDDRLLAARAGTDSRIRDQGDRKRNQPVSSTGQDICAGSNDVTDRRRIRRVAGAAGPGSALLRPGRLDGADGAAGDSSSSRRAEWSGGRHAERRRRTKRANCRRRVTAST